MPHISDAIADAEEVHGPADIVITYPPDGGDGSDVKNIDEENFQSSAISNEVAGQLKRLKMAKLLIHNLLVLRKEN